MLILFKFLHNLNIKSSSNSLKFSNFERSCFLRSSVRFIFMPDIDNHFHAESSELNVVNVLIAVAVVIIAAMAAGIVISKRNRY